MALHPKAIDLSLGRIERLLSALGHPERELAPTVHVAGTNGKGSTVAFLRAILEAAGYRVQAYTSPHLVRFAERIRLADGIIAEDRLKALLEECERANRGAPITFFEITTTAAFLAFAREKADALLLEVGLGGRLDATNVVTRPALCAITPVSIDHVDYLGPTIEAIAAEKAGILKAGVPALLGPQAPAALAVIEQAAGRIGAPVYRHGVDWTAKPGARGLAFRGRRWSLDLPPPGLVGAHQYDNAGLAIAAAEQLEQFRIAPEAVAAGLKAVEWPARLQRLERGPLVAALPGPDWELWLDGGHNPAGAEALARQAQAWQDRPLGLIFGMLRSKDAVGFLKPLARHARAIRVVAVPGQPNALSLEEEVDLARGVGMATESAPSLLEGLRALAAALGEPARILICGSLYLAGTVLEENG
jgi:dihydrofolate synthase / folylpolyglutamate synthase